MHLQFVKSENTFDYFEATRVGLTEFGAVKALEALKYISVKEFSKKRLLLSEPNHLEPSAKRPYNEKAEIEEHYL